jgi:hypothetical protein
VCAVFDIVSIRLGFSLSFTCITPVTLADGNTPQPPHWHASLDPVSSPQIQRKRKKYIVIQTDMDSLPNHPVADLGWSHVGIGLTFIAFNSILSQALQLHIGASLVSAALRCVVQLTLVATILQRVFAAENFWAVVGIACEYVVVCAIFTVKFDSSSITELTWHDRNRYGRYLITIHFSLADPRVTFANQVVIKAGRRCEDMVRVHHVLAERK